MTGDLSDAIPRFRPGTRHGGGLTPHSELPDRWEKVLDAAGAALDAEGAGGAVETGVLEVDEQPLH